MDRDVASPSMPESVGGRYEILVPIASGGMATVFLARARGYAGFEQDVALKLMHAHMRESREFAASLAEEGKLAARVRHRNVVSVIDVGDDPQGVFLVMEYVEGTTLSVLRQAPLPYDVALRILLDAMAGLHAAHETKDERGAPLGIVHRDFSPQNILVGLDGVGRLADFGIAKAANALDQTATGVIKGKLTYLSPEQARAERLDRRADLWAAGVIAWELFAGRRLHDSSEVGLLFRIASKAPPRLRSIDATIPVEVEQVVARALTLRRDDRWRTVDEYRQALANACRHVYGIAEHDEVGQHVRASVGSMLDARRAAVEQLLRHRRGHAEGSGIRITGPDGASAETQSMWKPPVVEMPVTDSGAVVGTRPSGAPRRYAWAAIATLLTAAAFGAVRLVTASGDPPAGSAQPSAENVLVTPTPTAPPSASAMASAVSSGSPALAAPVRVGAPGRRSVPVRSKQPAGQSSTVGVGAPPLAPDPYAR